MTSPPRYFFACLKGFALPAGLMGSLGLALGGCYHRSLREVGVDWIHDLRGGEIAKLHPPPPGMDDPYPYVALTPSTHPAFPSAASRQAITDALIADRNLAQREGAASGSLENYPEGRGTESEPAPPAPFLSSVRGPGSTSLASAKTQTELLNEASERSHAPRSVESGIRKGTASGGAAGEQAESAGVRAANAKTASPALPELRYDHPDAATAGSAILPHLGIPPEPPKPVSFPQFQVPVTSMHIRPDFDLADPQGTLVRFRKVGDDPAADQEKTYQRIVNQAGRRRLLITGFGAAQGLLAGLSPQEQENELSKGLLRARKVADILVARGIKSSQIYLAAQPIGDGVRVQIE